MRGAEALVFRGQDGLDELTTTGPSTVWVVTGGAVREESFDPAALGIARASLDDLRGSETAKAVGLVLPELNGKLDGTSIRVPTPNVSVIDFKFTASRATSTAEINDAITRAAEQQLKGVLAYTSAPNVSIDFNHDPHSSIFHMDQTKVMDGTLVSVLSWYDNEWGFSNRMADTAVAMAKLI